MIFDSGLDQLQLPILPSLSFDDPSDSEHHRGTLAVLLERYMEWKVEFPESELGFLGGIVFRRTGALADHFLFFSRTSTGGEGDPDDMQEDEMANVSTTRKSLKLSRLADGRAENDGEEDMVWTWTETVHTEGDGRRKTGFLWMDDD